MTERLKSEWIFILGPHPSIFTETGRAAPRSTLSPTAPWQIVCFTLFTSSRLSSEKRHDNLLCAHWRWIVITPQAMQMLLSASRNRPVLPPAVVPVVPAAPGFSHPTHRRTYVSGRKDSTSRFPEPRISCFNHYLCKEVLSCLLENCHEHSSFEYSQGITGLINCRTQLSGG